MNVTLKDVPTQLHARLVERAKQNRRSLSKEILAIIESSVEPQLFDPQAFARQVRARREQLPVTVQQDDLTAIIDDSRL